MLRFPNARDKYATTRALSAVESMVREHAMKQGRGPVPSEVDDSVVARVQVNHGRWIVECPFCPSAQYGDPDDQRFLCVDAACWNDPVGGRWVRVEWPPAADEIEQALVVRPEQHVWNWRPGETVKKLRDENLKMERAAIALRTDRL